ncbi:hypothetical protein Tco_1256795 [Tanacetum coccineum]
MSTYGFYPCFQCGRTNEFPHCPCSTCARCGSNLVNGDCFNCSTYSSANNTPNYYDYPPQPEYQTYSYESCGNDAHYGYPCPSFVPDPCYNRNFDCFPHDSQTLPQQYQTPPVVSMEMLHAQTDLIEAMQDFLKKYDHIPHNEKSIKLLLAEEKFLKIKQVVEEEQTQPEYLQELLQSLLKDLQILNEIQPLKQETLNQILKDQEEKSIAELLAEERLQKANQALNESQSPQEMRIQDLEIQKQQCLEEMKEWMNDLGIREIRKEEIDIDYRRKCEDKIYELKDKFNGLSIEIRKIIQEAEELRESEARARIQKIIIDDDDDDLGFYAVHQNKTIPSRFTTVEPKDSLIMGESILYHYSERTISVETFFQTQVSTEGFPTMDKRVPIIFDEFSFPRLPEEHNSENVDTIIESLSYSPIPVEDSDSLIEEIDLFLTSDDSMPPGIESDDYDSEGDFRFLEELLINDSLPLPENESYNLDSFDNPESPVVKSCFDFEPVAAVTNDFDVLNNDESFDSGEGENVDSLNVEEEDSFTFTIRSFLPFVTYPEVLPASYSTGSEDKVFNPGIFEKDAFKDKSSKELASSKALLTLDVFDPLHPPLMDFHVTKAFSGFTFSLLKIFSKKFFEPREVNNCYGYLSIPIGGFTTFLENVSSPLLSPSIMNLFGVFRILEDSWFNIVEGQSNAHNFH